MISRPPARRGRHRHEQHLAGGDACAWRRSSRRAAASMLDAPVSGGEIGAINATLSIMVGGDAGRVRARASGAGAHGPRRSHHPHRRRAWLRTDLQGLQSDCDRRRAGRRGRGLRGGGRRRASTARRCGRRCSADSPRAACSRSTASGCSTATSSPGFRARLFQKDLRIAEETAADEGVAVPVTDIVASRAERDRRVRRRRYGLLGGTEISADSRNFRSLQ